MKIERTAREGKFSLTFNLDPAVSDWELVEEKAGQAQVAYHGGGYRLVLEEDQGNHYTLVSFQLARDAGESFTVLQYDLEIEFTTVGLDRVWNPGGFGSYGAESGKWLRLFKNDDQYITSGDRRIPMLIAMDRASNTKLAAGFFDQRIETQLWHRTSTHVPALDQMRGQTRFRLTRPIKGFTIGPVTEYEDAVFLSSGLSWFDTVGTLRKVYDEKTGREFVPSPDISWEPVWSPWGPPKGEWRFKRFEEVTSKEFLSMAEVAAGLGLKCTMGWMVWWDIPDKTKTVEEYWGFPETIGDYQPGSGYRDLKETVQKLKALGIRAIPWFGPWMAGRDTKASQDLKEALIEVELNPSSKEYEIYHSYLCPRNPITQKHVVDSITRVIKEYDLDGFTVDMIDSMPTLPCTAKHEHNYPTAGMALADGLLLVRKVAQSLKPDFHIEYRQSYSNICNLYSPTAHRSVDSGDAQAIDANRMHCVQLRAFVPPGVAVHHDPIWWHPEEEDSVVAKMLANEVVTGVPQICADIVNIPDSHRSLIKGWLNFYQAHKEDFRWGQLRPVQNDVLFSTIKIECERKAFVLYASFPALKVPLSPSIYEVYLFNCTNEDCLYGFLQGLSGDYLATIHNYDHKRLSETELASKAGSVLIDMNVPQGGYIVLRRI